MKPYYEHGGIVIYHGDCREILPQLSGIDAVISDPPYGVGNDCDYRRFSAGPNHTGGTRNGAGGCEHSQIKGDSEAFNPSHLLGFRRVVLWGFPYFASRLPIGSSLIWLKRYDDGFGSFLSDAEIAWLNSGVGIYCRRDVSLQTNGEGRWHPTQKPVSIMQWCIKRAGLIENVVDPYCGSGSTLIAAQLQSVPAIGIEIEEKYCEIAAKRLSQEVFDFTEATTSKQEIVGRDPVDTLFGE